jgi:hypothetical protein
MSGRVLPFLIDPPATWAAVEARLASTTDPRRRLMLQTVVDHLRYEVEMDLDPLLATMVAEPVFHVWTGGIDYGPKGMAATTAFYQEFVDSGRGVFEFVVDRIVVDDATVVTEGTFYLCYSGTLARETGFLVEGDGPHLCPVRTVVVWPFDANGGLLGEDIWPTLDPSAAVALPDELVPARWWEVAGRSTS